MVWFCVWQVVSTLIELIRLRRRSESDKDLEILLLRRQLAIYRHRSSSLSHCVGRYHPRPLPRSRVREEIDYCTSFFETTGGWNIEDRIRD
jgi:hypothetical protein